MSFDTKGKKFFYVNFQKKGLLLPNGEFQNADVTNIFDTPILTPKSSDYICAVARFTIPTQHIPLRFFNIGAVQLIHRVNPALNESKDLGTFYSVMDMLQQLNSLYITSVPNGGSGIITFSLQASGKIRVTYDNYTNFYILLNDELFEYLGFLDGTLNNYNTGTGSDIGRITIYDMIDQVVTLRVKSIDLPVVSEWVGGNRNEQILSDFIMPRSFGISWTEDTNRIGTAFTTALSVSETPRQNIVYTPDTALLKPINLLQDSPIQKISLAVKWVDRDDVEHNVPLPPGCVFNVKMLFVSKD